MADQLFKPGQQVTHADLGPGVVVDMGHDGYVNVFFAAGQRRVHASALSATLTRQQRIINNVAGTKERVRTAWLHAQAHMLPLMENATALTSAPIDLLPHQIVLTHRVAMASPRRFLIADEVGLGKTIETGLILRELFSRGELKRALMVVPAGLVRNWGRELNEVFKLSFEIFGTEGDITDRHSNAFAKHDLLIASVDTLKQEARVKRLLEAPPWDLVVFDEAHHLSAYKYGRKVDKTANYKLAEALRSHTRDLLLLSATPHQGDHFRFWMLIQLLNGSLFTNHTDMQENRHRLNTVIFRRTKADACAPDGSPIFARRWVHTESFTMSAEENAFYSSLREYLADGFDLARKQGNKGRALGFVMTIFQKIAASSFAAVRTTLRRRQLMLTVHEAILLDGAMDVDGHQAMVDQARKLIHELWNLPHDAIGKGEADRVLADLRLKLLRKLDRERLEQAAGAESMEDASEAADMASEAVELSLPEERARINDLLQGFPVNRETKAEKLLRALGALWQQDPKEKVVVFATYLPTVDLLKREIEASYPGQGVVVLRGGDHAAKATAEKRFKENNGPRVMVCTAAGREGINLQFARILFNFDLPWNPMDVEQRIGRIHRYGQQDTAQVYNLVLSDTIEGRIYLMLEDKLREIAKTLGKVDDNGQVAEDLRAQILGQLSDKISYDQLYRDALSDPELKRTQHELEAATTNANEARKVVFQLFQDLDGFSMEDYKPLADVDDSKGRLAEFLRFAVESQGGSFTVDGDQRFRIAWEKNAPARRYTLSRNLDRNEDDAELLGLDHPQVQKLFESWRNLPPESIGASCKLDKKDAVLTLWRVELAQSAAERRAIIQPVASTVDGARVSPAELGVFTPSRDPAKPSLDSGQRDALLHNTIVPALQRELVQNGVVTQGTSFNSELIAWVESP